MFRDPSSSRAFARAVINGAAACAILSPTLAAAQESADQDVSPNVNVAERFARNVQAIGIKTGGFTLFPSLSYAQFYDDNIFGVETGATDDFIGEIRGGLTLRSNWSRHQLELLSGAQRLQYFDNSDESTSDYNFGGRGYLDIASRARLRFNGGWRRATESRRVTQTAIGGANPVRFDETNAGLSLDVNQTRLREQLGVTYQKDDFDDVALLGGPGVFDQDFRDREVYAAFFRQSVRIRPTVAAFAEIRGEKQEYGAAQSLFDPAVGAPRGVFLDSKGLTGFVGLALDINKVARGEIGVGYQKRNYDDPIFEDVSGFSVNSELEYFVSDLTTITVNATRSIQDSAVPGFAGFYANEAGLTIQHELLRPLLLTARATFRRDDFRDIDRQDDALRLSAGLDYAFRRNVVVSMRFERFDVSSDGAAARLGFTENIARLGIEFRL